ncbi:MAG: enterochelin esterase [Trueperaceae bacterium]|nr:enterochelin esterase [Trueperaceae bacterium]
MEDPLPRPASGITVPPKHQRPGPKLASSPTIAALGRALATGGDGALADFWRHVEAVGTPLVEPAPDSTDELLVTFVAREGDPAKDVVLLANRVTEPDAYSDSVLRRMPGTDLRHLTLRMRSDWRASYALGTPPDEPPAGALAFVERSLAAGSGTPRADLERWSGAQACARPDPLHRRAGAWQALVTDGSWVELPGVPATTVSATGAASDAAPKTASKRVPNGASVVEGGSGRVASGRLEETRFKSALLGNERSVWTYTSAAGQGDWLLVMTDGEDWARRALIDAVLDAPIAAGLLPPMTAVLIDSVDVPTRLRELACSPAFVDALDEELLPRLAAEGLAFAPERTIIAGASLGGLTAAYAALRAPHRFGNAYSQSGSLWWPTTRALGEEPAWLNRCFAWAERLPVKFRLEVGLHERGMLQHTRHLRDVLLAKGYDLSYLEFNGGHDRLWWVASLAEGLARLMGYSSSTS